MPSLERDISEADIQNAQIASEKCFCISVYQKLGWDME